MSYRAAAVEEDLVPCFGILIASPLLPVILHGVDAGGAQVPGLALDALAVRAERLEEAPVHEALAPGVTVLVAVVVTGGGKVPGILGPVAAAGVGQRIVEGGVGGLLPVADFGKSDGETTINNSTDFAMYLLEKGHVATVGGDAFGDPECFRMSYALSDENIVEAMKRIKEVVAKLK